VWGKAVPGEVVTVRLEGSPARQDRADINGHWRVDLPSDWDGLIPLQDHVVVEKGREFDAGQCRKKEWNHLSIMPNDGPGFRRRLVA
ncbi:MAG: hypothetical protein AAFO67_09025, partial [Planctomycetota bacterium]